MEFQEFPKIARLSRECVITEKIDGTNAQLFIVKMDDYLKATDALATNGDLFMFAGSRSQWITPMRDNHGFAKWVTQNADGLWALGEGRHFGEWWGAGIQRRYGLTEKRFSLFNTHRWTDENKPACCYVVPVLYRGDFQTSAVDFCVQNLRELGSKAAPGFMKPEGVIVYHTAAGSYFKKTLEKDTEHKGASYPEKKAV